MGEPAPRAAGAVTAGAGPFRWGAGRRRAHPGAAHRLGLLCELAADAVDCARLLPDWTRGACWSGAGRCSPQPLRCAESCAHPVQAHLALADHSNHTGRGDWLSVRGLYREANVIAKLVPEGIEGEPVAANGDRVSIVAHE
eukprot:1412059-Pleurochrysis_carterae.AAC.1